MRMKIDRKKFSKTLKMVSRGLASRGVLGESYGMFVFQGGKITTFNGEVRMQAKDPIGLTAAVPSTELMSLVDRFLSDEIDLEISADNKELRVSGRGGRAGIT